jgi:hypothetical protein
LAELALPDADGGWAPAGELMLPGSRLAAVLAEGSLGMLHEATARRVERSVLRAVGVLETFALVRAENPEDLEVDGVPAWIDAVDDRLPPGPPPSWPPVTAVSDLECVVDWPAALLLLADLPAAAWADVVLDGVAVPGYLRWWLCTHPVLDGERPDRLRAPGTSSLQGLYAPAVAESRLLSLLRPPSTVDDVVADLGGAVDLLDRLGDPGRTVRPSVLATVYAQLAVALDGADVDPPARVRVAADRVSSTAVVLDVPYLQPLVDRPVVPAGGAPGPVADLLDLPLASELVHGSAGGSPQRRLRWADVPGAGLAAARLGLDELGGEGEVHDGLSVSGRPVRWWPGDEGPDLVDGSPGALGRALAWRAEAWPLRHALAEAFAFPDRAEELWAEDSVGS